MRRKDWLLTFSPGEWPWVLVYVVGYAAAWIAYLSG